MHYDQGFPPGSRTRSLFYLVQPLCLIEIVFSDRNRSKQGHLVVRLLAISKERYQRPERSAYLATGQLLDSTCHVAGLDLSKCLGQSIEADQLHFAEQVAGFEGFQRAKRHVVVSGDDNIRRRRHARKGRLSHGEALRAIEAGGVFEDEFVFVLGLIEDIVQAFVAVDGGARTGLTLKVHDGCAVRKQLLYKQALCLTAFNIVSADMPEDTRDFVDAP